MTNILNTTISNPTTVSGVSDKRIDLLCDWIQYNDIIPLFRSIVIATLHAFNQKLNKGSNNNSISNLLENISICITGTNLGSSKIFVERDINKQNAANLIISSKKYLDMHSLQMPYAYLMKSIKNLTNARLTPSNIRYYLEEICYIAYATDNEYFPKYAYEIDTDNFKFNDDFEDLVHGITDLIRYSGFLTQEWGRV